MKHIHQNERGELENLEREQRLVQTQKQEAIACLAGGLAHDLNNALGIILGTVELALATGCDRDDLLCIQSAARSTATLARRLMTIAGREPAAPIPLDLNTAIERELPALHELLGAHPLAYRPDLHLPPVTMDVMQVRQLVETLATNALEASAEGSEVLIETGKVELDDRATSGAGVLPGTFVVLAVGYTATRGEIDREHAFDPYFPRPNRKRPGLGLAPVLGILRQNHGFAQVDCPHGDRVTYRLFLPRCHELLPG